MLKASRLLPTNVCDESVQGQGDTVFGEVGVCVLARCVRACVRVCVNQRVQAASLSWAGLLLNETPLWTVWIRRGEPEPGCGTPPSRPRGLASHVSPLPALRRAGLGTGCPLSPGPHAPRAPSAQARASPQKGRAAGTRPPAEPHPVDTAGEAPRQQRHVSNDTSATTPRRVAFGPPPHPPAERASPAR